MSAAALHQLSQVYKYKVRFGSLNVPDVQRVKALIDNRIQLMKFLAGAMLDLADLTDISSINGSVRREAQGVAYVVGVRGLNQRRAREVWAVD